MSKEGPLGFASGMSVQSVQNWINCRPLVLHLYVALQMVLCSLSLPRPLQQPPWTMYFSPDSPSLPLSPLGIRCSCGATCRGCAFSVLCLAKVPFKNDFHCCPLIREAFPSLTRMTVSLPTVFSPHCFRLSSLAPSTLLFVIYVYVCPSR